MLAQTLAADDQVAGTVERHRGKASIGASTTLSSAMWNLDWSRTLPIQVADDVIIDRASFEEIAPFVAANYAAMFEEKPEGSPFARDGMSEAKAVYYDRCGDFFAFKQGSKIVGVLVCNPSDWSTYYIRFSAFLPEFQGRQLLQRFFPRFFSILKAVGVQRVETETSPSNLPTMHIMNRFRFNTTGNLLSERFGAVIRFTKFLDEHCEQVFLDQFCTGIRYQARDK